MRRAEASGTPVALPGPQAQVVLDAIRELRTWLDEMEAYLSPGSGTLVKRFDDTLYVDIQPIHQRLLTGRRLLNPAAAVAEHHGLDG